MKRVSRRVATGASILALGGLIVGGGVVVANAGTDGPAQNLLTGHDWQHFAGAAVTSAGVHVTPLNRVIVAQDGTGGQPNPAVNLRGPSLNAGGDFRVSATLQGVGDKGASLRLYGQLPVIYDEWRQERPSVQIGVRGGKLQVAIWNGASDKPAVNTAYGSGLTGTVTIGVEHKGSVLTFLAGGKAVGTQDDRHVFASHRVWFGADAEAGGPGWTLSALTAQALNGSQLSVQDAPAPAQGTPPADSLRSLAAKGSRPILMGTAIASGPLFGDAAYRKLAGQQYSMITPENDMKPQFVHPQPGVYAFSEADALVDFARANGMKVHAHTLVWHEALPAWMRASMSADARRKVMLDHIDNVAGHFKGRVAEWDVINEPMSDDDPDYTNGNKGLRPSLWYKAMGEQYIDVALRETRKVDPTAKLFINEYGIEQSGARWDAFYALVKRLKQRGVPLDGVGFQNHEYEAGDRSPVAQFRDHVQKIAALGLQVRVSEMDVLADAGTQAKEFSDKLGVCRQSPACTSFSTWGFTDRYGSTADTGRYPLSPGDALPFGTSLQPKPAYKAMQKALS